MKTKVIDIKKDALKTINLNLKKEIRLKTAFLKKTINLALIITLVSSSFIFAQAPIENEDLTENSPDRERQLLEKQLEELEAQILEYEKTINEYRKQGNTLKNEIASLEAKIQQLNLKIKAINLNLEKLNQEIKITQRKINDTENKIENKKRSLAEAIRKIYESDSQSLLEIIIANQKLSEFFGDLNNILFVQDNLRMNINEIKKLREKLLEEKQELSLQYQNTEDLKNYQIIQQQQIKNVQNQKNNLLKVTKGKESEYQKLLQKTKETAAEIRKRIFRLLGGGELTFEEAYKYARLAEKATGVRAAIILAILDRESLFGKNVGRCLYNQKTIHAETAMNPKQIPIFLEILENLKKHNSAPPEPVYVSCPNKDGTYGGAMGPAQFLPSTWKLYEKEISSITGNKPPSPWNNADAFVAAALYIKEAMNSRSCQQYANRLPNQKQTLLERCAAAQYYAGGNWANYLWIYGEPVIAKANKFQQDIDILNS